LRVQKERRKKIEAPTISDAITPQKGKKKTEIIDGLKYLQCEVLLRYLKYIAPEEIGIAVDKVDAAEFSSERVVSLNTFLPTGDEKSKIERIATQGEELADLSQCERIMVQMMNVRHCVGYGKTRRSFFYSRLFPTVDRIAKKLEGHR